MTLLRGLAISACLIVVNACARVPMAHHQALRVMTYNIEYGHEGLDKVAAVIRDQHPDIVGLQEVDVHWSARSNFVDQAATLSKATGMSYRFAHIYEMQNTDASNRPREFGVALLSRYPITAFSNHNITRHSTQDSTAAPSPMPGLLEARIDVNGRAFRVFNVHLDYRGDATVRTLQVKEILQYIGNDTIPTILTGDLNAAPEAPELHTLLRFMVDAQGGVKDEFTYSTTKPEKRIDYVLTSGNICGIAARRVNAFASDHFPVVAEISSDKMCINFRNSSAP